MPDQITEDWHATRSRLGDVTFWEQRRAHSQPRRIQEINRPGQAGADTRDMGSGAKRTTISALLTRTQLDDIQLLRDAAEPVQYRDSVGVSYPVRIVDVADTAATDKVNWFQCEIPLIKADTEAEPALLGKGVKTPEQGAADVRRAWEDFMATTFDDFPGETIPDASASLNEAAADSLAKWVDFDALMTSHLDGGLADSVGAMARSFDSVASSIDRTVVAAELWVNSIPTFPPVIAQAYLRWGSLAETLKAAGFAAVAAMVDEGPYWTKVLTGANTDLFSLIYFKFSAMPGDLDSYIDRIIAANRAVYGPLDPMAIPAGIAIEMPRLVA